MLRSAYHPPDAQAGVRALPTPADPRDWPEAYAAFVADIHREVPVHLPSFERRHAWRGRSHRVLARNVHADIGISTWQGAAWVWIAVRSDREFHRRAEWIDAPGEARAWLLQIAPRFARLLTTLGCQQLLPNSDAANDQLAAA